MPNIDFKDGNGVTYKLWAEGDGSDDFPFVPRQLVNIDLNGAAGDAAGRFRTSNPETIYAQKFIYGKSDGTFFSEEINGSATSTHVPANSCIDMAVSTNGDYVIRQSRQRINYQAGKSQLFKLTGLMNPTAGTVQRIGGFQGGTVSPFDVLDGFCFEADGTTMYAKIYKGGVAVDSAAQSAWNVDRLDGSLGEFNPSGITVDWTKVQFFVVDYLWQGVGRVRFGLNIGGETIYVHKFNHANQFTEVYMRSSNQPVRYEIRSTGGAATLKQICCDVESEGGQNPSGLVASIRNTSDITGSLTEYRLLKAMRLKSGELDAAVILEKLNIACPSSSDYEYLICWNPIIAGAVNWVDVTGASIQEADGVAANVVTPLITIDSGFGSSDMDANSDVIDSTLRLGSKIDGTQDVIAIAVKVISGAGSETFRSSMTIRQLI